MKLKDAVEAEFENKDEVEEQRQKVQLLISKGGNGIITLESFLVDEILSSSSNQQYGKRDLSSTTTTTSLSKDEQILLKAFQSDPDRLSRLQQAKLFIEQQQSASLQQVGTKVVPSFQLKLNSFALLKENELNQLKFGFAPLDSNQVNVQNEVVQVNESLITSTPTSTSTSPVKGGTTTANFYASANELKIDWTPNLPVVKFQGFNCGGCWAFALTGLIEGHASISLAKSSSSGLMKMSLSEQEILNCDQRTKNRGCEGGNYYHSLVDGGFAFEHGFSLGRLVPYSFSSSTVCDVKDQVIVARLSTPTRVYFVDRNEQALLDALQHGPVAVALSSYNPSFQYYSGGILDDAEGCGTRVDHAALLVGAGVDSATGKKYWKIRNSWGRQWGEDGHIRLIRGDASVMQKTSGLGICGILTQANSIELAPPQVINKTVIAPGVVLNDPRFCTTTVGCVMGTESNLTWELDGNHFPPTNGQFDALFASDSFKIIVGISAGIGLLSLVVLAFVVRVYRKEIATILNLRRRSEIVKPCNTPMAGSNKGLIDRSTSNASTATFAASSPTPGVNNNFVVNEGPHSGNIDDAMNGLAKPTKNNQFFFAASPSPSRKQQQQDEDTQSNSGMWRRDEESFEFDSFSSPQQMNQIIQSPSVAASTSSPSSSSYVPSPYAPTWSSPLRPKSPMKQPTGSPSRKSMPSAFHSGLKEQINLASDSFDVEK